MVPPSRRAKEKGTTEPPPPGSPLAPPTKETFDQLAKRANRERPRVGSVVQPPPAWEPDEVTLGFAMVADPSGETRELPEPTVLATVLIAVENDRRALLHRFAGGFDEEIDAVANVFWPFLVVHGPGGDAAAIFDGTGVWRRTFRYTLLPSMDGMKPLLDREVSPASYLSQMRALTPHFARDPGSEVLTVEGFLPLDPPLLFDVLSQSQFRSDPQAPHAGFLPARHKVDWYHDVVSQMCLWLERFEGDLYRLGEVRGQVEKITQAAKGRLETEYREKQARAAAELDQAVARVNEEVAELQKSHHTEVQRHLESIRKAQGQLARSEATVATTDTLAFRATNRRLDPAPHQARGRQAQAEIRTANRQVASGRREIERVHEQQRTAQERAVAKVVELERTQAKSLAELELFHDEYVAAAADLLQTIDGQVAARSTQRNVLSGYFLPLPTLANVSVIWFPLWLATLRGSRGPRQLVFPPMQVRKEVGLSGSLKRFFGGIVLPLEPRTAQFDKVLRPTMEEALARDPWLSTATAELTRAADVLVDPDVLERLKIGLASLRSEGWITEKQQQEFYKVYADRERRRAPDRPLSPPAAAVAPSNPTPPGPA